MSDIIQNEGGFCQCGCGERTRVAPVNDRSKGWIKDKPLKYLKGHGIAVALAARAAQATGISLSSHGYIVIELADGSRRYEHMLVAERALGRPLKSYGVGHADTEVVHHINGVKTDNRPANLLVCTHAYHTALHARLEASPLWPEFPMRIRRPDLAGSAS